MTRRLYYDDPALLSFDAQVVACREVEGRTQIALDQTAFYPTSGGQPFDTGVLSSADFAARVIDVAADDAGQIWHVLDTSPPVRESAALHGAIAAERRLDHRQQHTGQHLLSAILWEKYQFRTVSFHLGAESSTIDVDTAAISPLQIRETVFAANQLITEVRPVNIHYGTAAEARAQGVRKIAPGIERVRLIEIAGVEFNACGGTHVNSTAEIGCLLVRGTERVKPGTRIEFVCGKRALHTAMRDYEELRHAGALLSVDVWGLAEQTGKLLSANKAAAKQISSLEIETAQLTARAMAASSSGMIVKLFTGRDAAFIKTVAQQLVRLATAPTIALFATAQPSPTLVLARSEHDPLQPLHSGNILKPVVAEFGGRGGGSAALAQGGIARGEQLQAALDRAAELVQRASATG